jgi:hypothetical protein
MNGGTQFFEVTIQGHLDPRRFQEFPDLMVTPGCHGETVLVGAFPDQGALYGLLSWFQGLGVSLISVKRLPPFEPKMTCVDGPRDPLRG